jgi:hypothetical protein
LSGIAHGLMALSALEMLEHKENIMLASFSLSAVIIKSIYELITGNVLLEFLQMGMCGTPIAACHAGGVTGGIFIFIFMKAASSRKISCIHPVNA